MNNGRVVKINNKSMGKMPLFYGNKITCNFKNTAIQGIQTVSKLSQLYFSEENFENVQQQIRYNVWIASNKKYQISKQSPIELEIVMRSMYLQHSKNLNCKFQEQIKSLNELVINWCVPRILSEIQQYVGYINDVENLPMPIDRPTNISNKGTKVLKSVTDTFISLGPSSTQ
tara:strand:- start:39 stop:554 length:516 start_codon:yes stop_codon:yes gene_type:complete